MVIRRAYDKSNSSQPSLTSTMNDADRDQAKRRKYSNGNLPPSASSSSQLTQPMVETHNVYESLACMDEDSAGPNNAHTQQKTVSNRAKGNRLPPISIINKGTKHIRELFNLANIPQSSYHMKAVKSGTQLTVNAENSFDDVIKTLKDSNTEFFQLKAELNSFDIQPLELKIFSQKKHGPEDSVLYLLYFEKNTVKLPELQRVKALFNVIVKWRYFVRRPNDVVQCHRCQKFGHGLRNCNVAPLCVKCGEKHFTKDCSLPNKATLKEGNDRDRVRCANCSGNHTANFHGCPSRKDYIKQLDFHRQRVAKKSNRYSGPIRVSTGATSNTTQGSNRVNTGRATYAQVLEGPRPQISGQSTSQLFTISEFLCLAEEMFQRLQSCNSKQQQFLALHELAIKFVYNA
ncbi:uncharacterized protein LOC134209790 [Armigeres subalbatus]|uniref:uncharacterized protein LOC134209790 n=1 Tax=Armigeres subalbatus TaxID=124917 RepID=UPI002ED1A51C